MTALDNKGGWLSILSILLIAALLFTMVNLRENSGNGLFPNGQSYYNLRIAKEISQDPFFNHDSLQERIYYPTAYHYALGLSIIWLGEDKTVHFMPVLLGVAFSALFLWLLSSFGFQKKNSALATFLLAVTPPFLASFSTLASEGFTAILSLLVLSFYFERNYWERPWKVSGKICLGFSVFFLAILAMTSLVGFAFTVIFMVLMSFQQSTGLRTLALAVTPAFLLFIPLAIFTKYLVAEWNSMGFHAFNIREAFSIFGAEMGLGIFLVLLFLTGVVIIWSLLKALRLYHLLALLLVGVSFFNPLLRIYASLVMLVYVVVAIKHLYYTKWELEVVKTGTILLVLCALIFSSLSQMTTLVNAEPGKNMMLALSQLRNEKTGLTVSMPQYGFLIQEYSGKKTYLDDISQREDGYSGKIEKYNKLMQAGRITDAKPILDSEGIIYIFITTEMKRDLWLGKEQGFLLLARNSESFDAVYSSPTFEVWKYKPQEDTAG